MVTDKDKKYRKLPAFLRHAIGKWALERPWFHGRKFLVKNGLAPEEYYVGPAFIFGEGEKDKVLQYSARISASDILSKSKHKNLSRRLFIFSVGICSNLS